MLDAVAAAGGHHAKAVELLGSYLTRYHGGDAAALRDLSEPLTVEGASPEEQRVARVLAAWRQALPAEAQDVIGLATAFRDPPTERRLLEYLVSPPVRTLCTRRGAGPMSRSRRGRPNGRRNRLTILCICACWSASAVTARLRRGKRR